MRRVSLLLVLSAFAVFYGCATISKPTVDVTTCREWLQNHPVYKIAKTVAGKPVKQDTLKVFTEFEKEGLVWVKPYGTRVSHKALFGHAREIPDIIGVTLDFEGKEYYQFNFPVDTEILTVFHLTKLCTGNGLEKLYAICWLRWCANDEALHRNIGYLKTMVLPPLMGEGEMEFCLHKVTFKRIRTNVAVLAVDRKLRGFDTVVKELAEEVRQLLSAMKDGEENRWVWEMFLEKLEKYSNSPNENTKDKKPLR